MQFKMQNAFYELKGLVGAYFNVFNKNNLWASGPNSHKWIIAIASNHWTVVFLNSHKLFFNKNNLWASGPNSHKWIIAIASNHGTVVFLFF